MFADPHDRYLYRGRDDEHSQLLAIDPRLLDFRTMPRNTVPATQATEDPSPYTQSEGPEQSHLPPLTQLDDAVLDSLHVPSTGGFDDSETLPTFPSFNAGLTNHLSYSDPSCQDQKAMLADSDRDPQYGILSRQPPIDRAQYIGNPFDATMAGLCTFDSPLSSSPTSFSPPLPPGVDALPTTQLEYQTRSSSSSSSYGSSTHRSSCGDIPAPDVARDVPQPTTVYPQAPAGNVTVVCQRRYQERQTSRMLFGVPRQFIWLGPYGYPVSSVHKGKKLAGLPNAGRRAFQHVDVGQKLSWRFLFDGYPESTRQFNVLDSKKTQPTIERIVRETVKALKCFKGKEPRFVYPLHRLVILEIELVPSASVQATIGVLPAEDATIDAWLGYIVQTWGSEEHPVPGASRCDSNVLV
ncbi:hypothetical protein GSI_10085 [Ganoderma sinense ZZ0214-1]|uniref:Uncharacterized protein n=1 Tax=Ganoderma sinense ZZ0214-1 TaxID=1077348 RepID=A0A2G8RZM9_9APHY|nr:hypothetical protein GSI_10085 [Ganoderma sinense ZZ0214-1]